ncbi:MAG: 50S ribosomal protein L35 [Candidatus Sumerlaeaceae bacterium]|jgi:large subunit ribosomal protein L35
MPKQKTKRSAAKRFRVTATGKIKRKKAYLSHILTSKDRKRKRRLRKPDFVAPVEAKRIKKLIPYK